MTMRTTPKTLVKLAGLFSALLLVTAACGNGDDDTATGGDTPATEKAPPDEAAEDEEPAAEEPAAEEPAPTVEVADSSLGEILVDAEGLSLYMFDPDEQGESTCYEDCEAAWPPLLVEGDPVAGDNVDESLLGTTEREDGTSQVTYNDWPLYYWARDEAAGDVTGQAVNDVWWVVGPDGEPIHE